ncbi:MAG: citrate/2-methylcitrate synthase [Acidilobaceae archaeon]
MDSTGVYILTEDLCKILNHPIHGRIAVVNKGLQRVVVNSTSISSVDPRGLLTTYRGYKIADLAKLSDFYDSAFLLLKGRLPCLDEYEVFKKELDKARASVEEWVLDVIESIPKSHPSYYAIVGSVLMARSLYPSWRMDLKQVEEHQLKVIAQLPAIAIYGYNFAYRGVRVKPDPSLPHVVDLLRMILLREPSEIEARSLEASLILYMDHGFNASTFALRVVASTLSDLYSAVAAAIGALKGPLHGAANEDAYWMFIEVEKKSREKGMSLADSLETYVKEKLIRGEKVPGFGHRVYKELDPRVPVLKEFIVKFDRGEEWLEAIAKAERLMKSSKGLVANVDLYTALLYMLIGIPPELYVPLFMAGRVVGWVAHYAEQLSNNKLIRPLENYVGPLGLEYVPRSQRACSSEQPS